MTSGPTERLATLRPQFLIVNPKAYLYDETTLELAKLTDELAGEFDIDTLFTAQHVDLRMVAEQTKNLIVTAQHVDPITVGRGMGMILPEALAAAGTGAIVLNHAEHPVGLAALDASIKRAHEVGLLSVVCADSDAQCKAVAHLGPDVIICEPTAQIGTGEMDDWEYVERTTKLVKQIKPDILVIQAAGVTSGADVTRVLELGADGSGGTSGIIKHPSWREILTEMYTALANHRKQLQS